MEKWLTHLTGLNGLQYLIPSLKALLSGAAPTLFSGRTVLKTGAKGSVVYTTAQRDRLDHESDAKRDPLRRMEQPDS